MKIFSSEQNYFTPVERILAGAALVTLSALSIVTIAPLALLFFETLRRGYFNAWDNVLKFSASKELPQKLQRPAERVSQVLDRLILPKSDLKNFHDNQVQDEYKSSITAAGISKESLGNLKSLGVGIYAGENSCFMNAAFQYARTCPELVKSIRNLSTKTTIQKNFLNLCDAMKKSNSIEIGKKAEILYLSLFKQSGMALEGFTNREQAIGSQQDPTEFLGLLLQHIEFKGKKEKSTTTVNAITESIEYSIYPSISLDINHFFLNELIDNYLNQTMDNSVNFTFISDSGIEYLDKVKSWTKKIIFGIPPPLFLSLHLKRFGIDHAGNSYKNSSEISINSLNSLSGNNTLKINSVNYQVTSFLVHTGNSIEGPDGLQHESLQSGHYVACAHINGAWFLFDDKKVVLLKNLEVDNYFKQAYHVMLSLSD